MSHRRLLITATVLIAGSPLAAAWADDVAIPTPPPQHEWIGKGQFGFLDSKGNSDAESVNGAIDLTRYDDVWTNTAHAEGLYGKSAGIISAERWEANEQTNYSFTPKMFVFGGLRFEHDLFDGFVYQASFTTGIGYNFIATDSDKLTAQIGPGFRRLRPETIDKGDTGAVMGRTFLPAQSEVIAAAKIDYAHHFNATTTLTNKFLIEHGSTDNLTHDEVALTVKMSTKLALSVGYAITDNSKPPAPLLKVDKVSTVNLVFAF